MEDGTTQNSPAYFRRRGGIGEASVDGTLNNHHTNASWGCLSSFFHGQGPWIHLDRSLSNTVHGLYAGREGYIVFDVVASPNMITVEADQMLLAGADPSLVHTTVAALGGVQWTQIRRWTYLSYDQWQYPESFEWQANREYNRSWERLGPSGPQPALRGPQLSLRGPPPRGQPVEELSVPYEQRARSFMDFLTRFEDELRLMFVRLDWSIGTTQPNRETFPSSA